MIFFFPILLMIGTFHFHYSFQIVTKLYSKQLINKFQVECNSKQINNNNKLSMILIPISSKQLRSIVSKQVTPEQWLSYWGNNKIERLQRVLESVLIAYGGAWLSWFISFMAGGVVSAFVGTGLIFNWMFSPFWNAYNNNKKIILLNDKPLHHAIYKGKIISLSKIRRRSGKSIGALSQDYLDMTLSDENGIELEILTPWQSDYRKLRVGMTVAQLIASKYKDFSVISVISDAFIPACNVWMGDYPYLQKDRFRKLLNSIEKSLKSKYESNFVNVQYNAEGISYNNLQKEREVPVLLNSLNEKYQSTRNDILRLEEDDV